MGRSPALNHSYAGIRSRLEPLTWTLTHRVSLMHVLPAQQSHLVSDFFISLIWLLASLRARDAYTSQGWVRAASGRTPMT